MEIQQITCRVHEKKNREMTFNGRLIIFYVSCLLNLMFLLGTFYFYVNDILIYRIILFQNGSFFMDVSALISRNHTILFHVVFFYAFILN